MTKELTPDPWNTTQGDREPSIGHIAGSPRPGKWNSWVMEQDAVWVDINNDVYLVSDISERYAYNILRFLWRNIRIPADPTTSPLIMALFRRLNNGQTPREVFDSLVLEAPYRYSEIEMLGDGR